MKKTLLAALALAGCASVQTREIVWEPLVVYEGESAFERLKVGRPDASDPNPQIVGVDQRGDVVLVHFNQGVAPRAEVIHRNGCELTGLCVSDVDASVPGQEIYAGGYLTGESGGTVTQIALTAAGVRARRIWVGGAYVHSVERVEPQPTGEPARLLVCTYAGEIHLLSPTAGDGPWDDRLLWRDAPAKDAETPKIKDAAFLRDPSGRAPHEALVAFKTSRALYIDIDRPEAARVVHEEDGGLSRVAADADGGAYVTGYKGRVLHFVRDGAGFKVDVMHQEGVDGGTRGIVAGRFPLPQGGVAPFAIFGFNKLVRALSPRLGAWDPTTLHRDADRGHTMEAADLVPGNDADELIVSGYSKRITVLVARR